MTPAPNRRWSFSLRTLFVVVTLLGILGWWLRLNAAQVRERKEFIAYLWALEHQPNPRPLWLIRWDDGDERIPIVWRCMGVTHGKWGQWLICNSALNDEHLERAKRLLPDATIEVRNVAATELTP